MHLCRCTNKFMEFNLFVYIHLHKQTAEATYVAQKEMYRQIGTNINKYIYIIHEQSNNMCICVYKPMYTSYTYKRMHIHLIRINIYMCTMCISYVYFYTYTITKSEPVLVYTNAL